MNKNTRFNFYLDLCLTVERFYFNAHQMTLQYNAWEKKQTVVYITAC